MKWFDLFKKEPVDEAIDDLEEVADNYDLSEHEWSSCLLYTSPSPRDRQKSRMPSSA